MPILPDPPPGPILTPFAPPAIPSAPAVAPAAPEAVPPLALDGAPVAPVIVPSVAPPPAGSRPVGIAGLAVANALRGLSSDKPSALELMPGRYPDAVSLPSVLKTLPTDPAGQAFLKGLIAKLEAGTGIKVPEALVSAILANPVRLTDALQATVPQIASGIDAMNLAYASGTMPDPKPAKQHLPKVFDLAQLASTVVERPASALKEIGPNIFQGDLASDLDDPRARNNIAMAEIFDRLSRNQAAAPKDRFKIKYRGGTYTRLDTFAAALMKAGHQIEVTFEHRIANFFNLKTKAPDGSWLDVPAAILVRTGITSPDGREAVVPTVHSEMVIKIRSDEGTGPPKVDADLKWYQGVSGTGFFPCDLHKTPSWCGREVMDTVSGNKALKAIELAGLLGDVIQTSAAAHHFAIGGYGKTGVCNDSVGLIQHAVLGRTTAYPLLMNDSTVADALTTRLSDADHRDDPEYRRLDKSIEVVPSDVDANESQRERALASIPWADGKEPFASSVEAKAILTAP